ncbi:MAG TPA: hypothetical protein IAB70_01840 [Candidatus Merdicola faecigallinarum]|uniref:Uncharacterized protein n=1 Tax=Candidatus Merdicola faecigallinarum TaxID=2840862 RepID=A0A9D1M038_9FIRM|nr:hypothetical protein [Candidatus Merdicola faecigallinarum]
MKTKYIFVTGGVVSGLGRGINVTKDVPREVKNIVRASSIKSSKAYSR